MQAPTANPIRPFVLFVLGGAAVVGLLAFGLNSMVRHEAGNGRAAHVNTASMETDAPSGAASSFLSGIRAGRSAARDGDVQMAASLIAKNLKVDQDMGRHETMLMLAAQRSQEQMVHFLVEHGANVDGENIDGKPAVVYAAEAGSVPIVLYLLGKSKSPDVNRRYVLRQLFSNPVGRQPFEATLLRIAVEGGHMPLARALIERHADVDAHGTGDTTPLSYAAAEGNPEMVKFLIDSHADVNAGSDRARSPLHYASKNHHEEIAKMLVAAGAKAE